jgi:hypothetical protein
MPWSPKFVLGLEVAFENNLSDHETWSIWWRVGVHVHFTSVLHSYTPLVTQAECEADLHRLRLFHQWECLRFNGHGLSISCVKWSRGPMTITLQALSWWKGRSQSKFASHYARGTNKVSEYLESYMASNGSCFIVMDYFQIPRDLGTPNLTSVDLLNSHHIGGPCTSGNSLK